MNDLVLSERLTNKNRLFLDFVADGMPIGEAYQRAGYKGDLKNAYDLKWKLKTELGKILEGKGFSREGVQIELSKLNTLPLISKEITVDQKLRILKLVLETLPESKKAEKGAIQPFVVVKSDSVVINQNEKKEVIEVKRVDDGEVALEYNNASPHIP